MCQNNTPYRLKTKSIATIVQHRRMKNLPLIANLTTYTHMLFGKVGNKSFSANNKGFPLYTSKSIVSHSNIHVSQSIGYTYVFRGQKICIVVCYCNCTTFHKTVEKVLFVNIEQRFNMSVCSNDQKIMCKTLFPWTF